MDVPFFSSSQSPQAGSVLSHPEMLVPGFFHCPSQDLVLYTHDTERRVTFISPSAAKVFEVDLDQWRRKNYELLLTNHAWNAEYVHAAAAAVPTDDIQTLRCEILSERGRRIQLEVRRQGILREGAWIGVIGLTRRIPSEEYSCQLLRQLFKKSEDPCQLIARWETLTASEKDVVQLVVDGAMNKMIARRLNIAERTVEARRSKIMKKLDLQSVPDLVRFHLLVQHWIAPSLHDSPGLHDTPVSRPAEQN